MRVWQHPVVVEVYMQEECGHHIGKQVRLILTYQFKKSSNAAAR